MQPTIEILEKVSSSSRKNPDEVFTRLFRYMLRADIYYVAYQKLYSNNGAATQGVDGDTADGFSEEKVAKIIKSLADETYTPKPSRRTYIAKANGKMRPLGIPTFTDKLVQEVLRLILVAVYEPIFFDCSHGFRPNRSCHTALKAIKPSFNGVGWFVEGDIKGCFDNINHSKLVELIGSKIKDARLIKLLHKFLKAGYCEEWVYNRTYSGTPQGGIISPILSNIYLHELDKFVLKLQAKFKKPADSLHTEEYQDLLRENRRIRWLLNNSKKDKKEQWLAELKEVRKKMLQTPCKSQTDKKIKYVRYADDFIIGVNGSHEDCLWIKNELKEFISEVLVMELSEEKTLITHSNSYARFLGYDVRVRRSSIVKKNGKSTQRTLSYMVDLSIPFKDKIERYLFDKKIVKMKDGKMFPIARNAMIGLTDLEILSTYNSELRGLCNYYNMAGDFCHMSYFSYLMEYSCLKTLAGKHKSKISKITNKFADKKGGWCIPYETKAGSKSMYFAKYQDSKNVKAPDDSKEQQLARHIRHKTKFEDRLKAKVCELCGCTDDENYQVHHVNKVKNLKGKSEWERVMIAKRRKTIVVCQACHNNIHYS